jgi:RES domain-containing protein
LPPDLVSIEIDIPSNIEIRSIDLQALSPGWRHFPGPESLQTIGDEWLAAAETAVLRVPSALIPEEFNYLINPEHAATVQIEVIETRVFTYDVRLNR